MAVYTDNYQLMKFINSNDLRPLKIELIENIMFLQGNKEEIQKAVDLALEKTDLKFQEHEEIETYETDDKDLFSEEKINMFTNYSRERYNRLIDLFIKAYKPVQQDSSSLTVNDRHLPVASANTTAEQDIDWVKIAVIAGSVLVAGYLVSKMF